jgi:tetratricopeptide (TPR) repeat protein
LAVLHLQQLRIRAGNQPEINFLEGLAFYRLGQLPAAINALKRIETGFPAAAALLMELYQRSGSSQLAREQAVAVHRQLQQMVSEGGTLTEDQLRWQSAATGLIGDSELAQAAVDQWYRQNPDSPDARQNRAAVMLARFERWLPAGDGQDVASGLKLLLEAAGLTPIDKFDLVRRRLQIVVRTRGQSPRAAAVYEALMADEQLPGAIAEYLGTIAAVEKDWQTSERLLKRATVNSPELAVAWNNLAYVLSSNFPNRRNEAVDYANRAVELEPLNVDYRETRGMIYFNLKRWDQAIEDLEVAVNGARDLDSIHLALAESYRQIGNPTLADVYQKQVRRP